MSQESSMPCEPSVDLHSFALEEAKIALVHLFQRFVFELEPGQARAFA